MMDQVNPAGGPNGIPESRLPHMVPSVEARFTAALGSVTLGQEPLTAESSNDSPRDAWESFARTALYLRQLEVKYAALKLEHECLKGASVSAIQIRGQLEQTIAEQARIITGTQVELGRERKRADLAERRGPGDYWQDRWEEQARKVAGLEAALELDKATSRSASEAAAGTMDLLANDWRRSVVEEARDRLTNLVDPNQRYGHKECHAEIRGVAERLAEILAEPAT